MSTDLTRACSTCGAALVAGASVCERCVPTAPPADPDSTLAHSLIETVKLAAPVVVTMTSYTLMQWVDKLMVSKIGPEPIYVGAQGNASLASFVPIAILMGVLTVVNTYVSQNLGAGRPERGPAYAFNGLWIALVACILLVPYGLMIDDVFRLLGHTPEQIALQTGYAKILIFGAFLTVATRGIAQFFFGMHRPMIIMIAALTGNAINISFNYGLIFGNLGLPRLELEGAAIATLLGSAVEFIIPMAVFLGPAYNRLYRTRAAWRPSRKHIKDLLRVGWPGGLMFGNEMICWAFFMVYLVSHFGPLHATAGWIAHQWMALSFMPTVGITMAVTAMVGKCIGMGRHDLAARRAWMGVAVAMGYMGFCGVMFIVLREPMIRLFINDETSAEEAATVVRLGASFMIAVAAFQLFDAIAMTLSAALRGAGDTVWIGVLTVVLSWLILVVGGLAVVEFFPGLESFGPWLAASAYIVILSFLALARFLSGAWKKFRLLESGGTPGEIPPAELTTAAATDGI